MIWLACTVMAMIAFTALYVAAEFASVAARRSRIGALAEQGNRTAQRLMPHLADATALDRYVAACQVGITVSSLVLGAYGQGRFVVVLEEHLPAIPGWSVEAIATGIVLLVLTTLHVVLGELVPKAVAIRFPERTALALTHPMLVSLWVYGGFITILNGTGNWLLRLAGVDAQLERHVHSPEELECLMEHSYKEGRLQAEETLRLRRTLHFGDRSARELMVPRSRLVGLDIEATQEEIRRILSGSLFTRYPIFRGDLDKIEGSAHLQDLTLQLESGILNLESALRPVLFIPQTLEADEVLRRMQLTAIPLAVVLDEYGGTAGLVTVEDLLEEVFGEFSEEPGRARPDLHKTEEGHLMARAELSLARLRDETGIDLSATHATSLGGFIMEKLGRVPEPGEVLTLLGLELRIEKMRGPSIRWVRLIPRG